MCGRRRIGRRIVRTLLAPIVLTLLLSSFALTAAERPPRSSQRSVRASVPDHKISPLKARRTSHTKALQQAARPPKFVTQDDQAFFSTDEILTHESCDSCSNNRFGCDSFCNRRWLNFEFLMGWQQSRNLPPLVTNDTLDQPATTVHFGNEQIGDRARVGARFDIGTWLGRQKCWGAGIRFFTLGNQASNFELDAESNLVFGRPFLDVSDELTSPLQEILLINDPTQGITGNVAISSDSQIHNTDVYFRRRLVRSCCNTIDFLVGYQNSWIQEDLTIQSTSTAPVIPGPGEATLNLRDSFDVSNEFNGTLLGVAGRFQRRNLTCEALAKVGLGNMQSTVTIQGQTTRDTGGGPLVEPGGGLLARSTNIGRFTREEFSIVPELQVKLIYELNACVALTLGYSAIWWTEAGQVADQLDPLLASNLSFPATGTQNPGFNFQPSTFWVQTINAGLQMRF